MSLKYEPETPQQAEDDRVHAAAARGGAERGQTRRQKMTALYKKMTVFIRQSSEHDCLI